MIGDFLNSNLGRYNGNSLQVGGNNRAFQAAMVQAQQWGLDSGNSSAVDPFGADSVVLGDRALADAVSQLRQMKAAHQQSQKLTALKELGGLSTDALANGDLSSLEDLPFEDFLKRVAEIRSSLPPSPNQTAKKEGEANPNDGGLQVQVDAFQDANGQTVTAKDVRITPENNVMNDETDSNPTGWGDFQADKADVHKGDWARVDVTYSNGETKSERVRNDGYLVHIGH